MLVLSTTSSLLLGTLYAFAVTRAGAGAGSLVRYRCSCCSRRRSSRAWRSSCCSVGAGCSPTTLLGLETSIYGWHGLWLAQTLSFFPVAYLVLRGAFMAADTSLEQAARGLGAGRWQVLRSVTLPLVTPALLAAALFISIGVLGDFGNPMLVGGRFQVLATAVYTHSRAGRAGTSAAWGLICWCRPCCSSRHSSGFSPQRRTLRHCGWLPSSCPHSRRAVSLVARTVRGDRLRGGQPGRHPGRAHAFGASTSASHSARRYAEPRGLGTPALAALASVLCTVLAGVVAFS